MRFVIRESSDLEPGQYRKQYICTECIAQIKHRHDEQKGEQHGGAQQQTPSTTTH
jgi:hypothetical protein